MIPRVRIDASWSDVISFFLAGWRKCKEADKDLISLVEKKTSSHAVAGLSNRTLFDALIESLELQAGDEVMMSALTIRDMAEIVRAHQLIPVPLDIEMDTLAPATASLDEHVSKRTKVLVIAPLCGGKLMMDSYQSWCDENEVILIEDMAQAYDGAYFGTAAHRIMSFGPIKAKTAFAGGILITEDASLAAKVDRFVKSYPALSSSWYRKRVRKMALLKIMTTPFIFGIIVRSICLLGKDPDTTLGGSAKGFSGDLLTAIRHAVPSSVCYGMKRRIDQGQTEELNRRDLEKFHEHEIQVPGHKTVDSGTWIFPILSSQPTQVVRNLRKIGIDATQGSSSMTAISRNGDRGSNQNAKEYEKQVVYIPHCEARMIDLICRKIVEYEE